MKPIKSGDQLMVLAHGYEACMHPYPDHENVTHTGISNWPQTPGLIGTFHFEPKYEADIGEPGRAHLTRIDPTFIRPHPLAGPNPSHFIPSQYTPIYQPPHL